MAATFGVSNAKISLSWTKIKYWPPAAAMSWFIKSSSWQKPVSQPGLYPRATMNIHAWVRKSLTSRSSRIYWAYSGCSSPEKPPEVVL